jgi:hypothetical protein
MQTLPLRRTTQPPAAVSCREAFQDAGRATLMRVARRNWISFLDADNLWHETWLTPTHANILFQTMVTNQKSTSLHPAPWTEVS